MTTRNLDEKVKTRKVIWNPANLHCPDCDRTLVWVHDFEFPIGTALGFPEAMILECNCTTPPTRYRMPTLELEVIEPLDPSDG